MDRNVLINLDEMAVHAVHPSSFQLADLAWIELQGKAYCIIPVEESSFTTYSSTELISLLSSVKVDCISNDFNLLLVTLVQSLVDLGDADMEEVELRQQASTIKFETDQVYFYVKGSTVPSKTKGGNLWIQMSGRAKRKPIKKQAVKTEKPKTQKEVIWSYAQKKWEEAGSIKDKSHILALRRKIMPFLIEEFGISKNSASIELGNWQKSILKS